MSAVLLKGENMLLECQGGYKDRVRAGWRPGRLLLSNERLWHQQRDNVGFATTLAQVRQVSVEEQRVVLKNRPVVRIDYGDEGNIRKCWLLVDEPREWESTLSTYCGQVVTEQQVHTLADGLLPQSAGLLLYIWHAGHANIDELARQYDAPSHMDVLRRIEEEINPLSRATIGIDILVFRHAYVDPGTGAAVRFSWCFNGRRELSTHANTADVFDEGDRVEVIVDMKGLPDEAVGLELDPDELTLRFEINGMGAQKKISLPGPVMLEGARRRHNNNLLILSFRKTE